MTDQEFEEAYKRMKARKTQESSPFKSKKEEEEWERNWENKRYEEYAESMRNYRESQKDSPW